MTKAKRYQRPFQTPRPKQEVLEEWQEERRKVGTALADREPPAYVLLDYIFPPPEGIERWQVKLACGCVKEVFTSGGDQLPSEGRWPDFLSSRSWRLPPGQMTCVSDDHPRRDDYPSRLVTEWREGGDVVPAHEMTLDGVDEMDDRVLMIPDKREWEVVLDCGHHSMVRIKDLDWLPEHGHQPRSDLDPAEQAEMVAKFRQDALDYPEIAETCLRAERWWAEGCPEPHREFMCCTCPTAYPIVGYVSLGTVAPKPKPAPKAKAPTKATLQRRLAKMEADAARLRDEIAQAPEDDDTT